MKQEKPILVILGNPPYNGFAGVAVEEERDLSRAYRTSKKVAAPQGQGLNDLYIRFFRMAERGIVEKNGQGIVCFISNYSWLDGLSFTGMRERYLEIFDQITIDCLNGDKYKTGKLTPEGAPDPSVFSTEFNHEGIQVGTAVATLVRKENHAVPAAMQFRHFWGKDKRAKLLQDEGDFQEVRPVLEMGLSFMPGQMASSYLTWPLLTDLFPISFPGVKTSRDDFVVAIDRVELERRLSDYFNRDLAHEEIARRYPGVMTDSARFQARTVREHLLRRSGPLTDKIVRFCYRPFDVRWLYWEPETKLLDEKRSEYFSQVFPENIFLCAVQHNRKPFDPPVVTESLACLHTIERGANLFPLHLRPEADKFTLFTAESAQNGPRPNLTPEAIAHIETLGLDAETLFYHIVAVLHAPAYRLENDGALRQDWPRIPLPGRKEILLVSAALGRQVAVLLDTEKSVAGVTTGKIQEQLKPIALFQRVDGKPANPEAGELDLTAGWGHGGKGGVTMPGKGKMIRREDGAWDIFLNEVACWRNVPGPVWDYTIGGYQVIKKWLSYREKSLLGRGLTSDEVRYVTEVARRIMALVALHPELDTNYQQVVATTYAFPQKASEAS